MAPRPKAEPLPSPPQHARTSLSGATFCHCHGVFLCCPHVYCLVRSQSLVPLAADQAAARRVADASSQRQSQEKDRARQRDQNVTHRGCQQFLAPPHAKSTRWRSRQNSWLPKETVPLKSGT